MNCSGLGLCFLNMSRLTSLDLKMCSIHKIANWSRVAKAYQASTCFFEV